MWPKPPMRNCAAAGHAPPISKAVSAIPASASASIDRALFEALRMAEPLIAELGFAAAQRCGK
jgi:hypothetical protein